MTISPRFDPRARSGAAGNDCGRPGQPGVGWEFRTQQTLRATQIQPAGPLPQQRQ
jgi:hypothetical protein